MLKLEKCTLYFFFFLTKLCLELPSKAKQHTNMCHGGLLLYVKISYKNLWSTGYDSELATWGSMIGIKYSPFHHGSPPPRAVVLC